MTTTTPAAPSGEQNLDHLEALARAATPGPWTVRLDGTCSGTWPRVEAGQDEGGAPITVAELSTTHIEASTARSSGEMPASYEEAPHRFELSDQQPLDDAAFIAAANPAAVLELLALARRAAPVSAPIAIKPWQQRAAEHKTKWHRLPPPPEDFMSEEIAELRAALANQPAPEAK